MDRISFAATQLRRILPDSVATERSVAGSTARRLHVWMREDVVRAVEEFVGRPRFQEHAAWPLRVLRPDAWTPERHQVDELARLMAQCSKELASLLKRKLIQRGLRDDAPAKKIVVGHAVEIGIDVTTQASKTEWASPLEIPLAQIEALARAGAGELVQLGDYFEPIQEFVSVDGELLQRGDFIVAHNPELLPVGNFICRCLMRRLELLIAPLTDVRRRIAVVQRRTPRQFRNWESFEAAWNELQSVREELEQLLLTGADNRLRDSCIILTQVYTAFHPRPNVAWLGLPTDEVARLDSLRARLTGWNNVELVERVTLALTDLRRLYPNDSESVTAKDEAVASGKLVIDRADREVYWEGILIDVRWKDFKQSWRFLEALAKKTCFRGSVGERDLYDDKDVSSTAMSSSFSRLKTHLPPSLWRNIESGDDPRTYRLSLEPERVHFCD